MGGYGCVERYKRPKKNWIKMSTEEALALYCLSALNHNSLFTTILVGMVYISKAWSVAILNCAIPLSTCHSVNI